jgi:hypothetical protein
MNRIFIITIPVAILASIFLAFYGREKFYFISITGFVTLLIFATSLLFTLLFLILGKIKKSTKLITVSKYTGLLLLVNLLLFCSVFISDKIAQYDYEQAKTFCDTMVAKVEQYKSENGKYPGSIDKVISDDVKLPLRIKSYSFYQTNGNRYRFVIPIIGPNPSGYVYDSKNRNWELIDFIFDLEEL